MPPRSPAPASARQLERELEDLGDPQDAVFLRRFFKTGPGQYGEGDVFLGIRVPVLRALARRHQALPLQECVRLLHSPHHEARLLALLILVRAYQRGGEDERECIHELYLANSSWVNNWDLVDASAEHLVGAHVTGGDRAVLARLARSPSVWERRMAILATFHLIKQGAFAETFAVADALLSDPHDLIHKAVGWMLREVGKRDRDAEEEFLRTRYRRMPRTMPRYAIERFTPERRQRYLRGKV